MKLTDVLSDANRTDAYPIIITGGDLTVTFYNGAATGIFKGIENGHSLEQYAEVYNKKEILRSRYPSSVLLRAGDKRYLCAFCPVIMGFQREYVFTVATPKREDNDDSEYYLSMKTAVLLKCMGEFCGADMIAGAKKAYAKLYGKYEANMRLITAIAGNVMSAAVNVKELLGKVFSYYCALKYGGEDRKRYGITADEEIMRLNNVLCVVIVTAFDLCEKLAQNGYCEVTLYEDKDEKTTNVRFDFKPKSKLISASKRQGDMEDAIYSVLGRDAEDLHLIRALTDRINGHVDIRYENALATIAVTVPSERGMNLRAHDYDLLTASKIAAERLV